MEYEAVRDLVRQMLSTGGFEAPRQAETCLREMIDQPGTDRDRGMMLQSLGQVLAMQGKLEAARAAFDVALSMVSSPADRLETINGYTDLLVGAAWPHLSEPLVAELADIVENDAIMIENSLVWAYISLAQLRRLQNDAAGACEFARMGVQEAERTGTAVPEAYTNMAKAQELAGDTAGAMASLEEAMVHMRNSHCLLEARTEHSRLAIAVGDVPTAVRSLRFAVELPDLRDRRVIAKVMRAVSALFRVDPEAAVRLNDTLAAHLEAGPAHSWKDVGK